MSFLDAYRSVAKEHPDGADMIARLAELEQLHEEWAKHPARPLTYPFAMREGSFYGGPYVPLTLEGVNAARIDVHALVDSGAATSTMSVELMPQLGITPEMCSSDEVHHGTGGRFRAHIYRPGLWANVAGYRVLLRPAFVPGSGVVVGREDFLRKFDLRLNVHDQWFRLEPREDTEYVRDE